MRKYIIIYGFFWLTIMALHVLILQNYGISIYSASIDSFISNTLLFVFCLMISNVLRFYQPGPGNAKYLIIWCLILSLIWFAILKFLIPITIGHDEDFMSIFSSTGVLRVLYAVLLMGLSVMIMWVRQNIINQKEEGSRHLQALKLLKDSELSMLKQQLQPHFLFNSLNSISALAGTNPQKAREMIQQLSEFLRGTLKKDNNQWISLSDEIEHLNLYLEIEKVRFGHRLKTKIDIDVNCKDFKIPPLILQPIVENAIKFGLYDTLDEVCINLSAKMENSMLRIGVFNPFDSNTKFNNKGLGFGLESLKRRLFLIYNRNDLLETETEKNIFKTFINIPQ